MTEPYILGADIQIPTEKDSSVFKWFQIWRNLTSFDGTFKFQLKKRVQYWNDYKDDRTLHSLSGHSNSDWKYSSVSKWFQRSLNFTSSVGTFKFQLKNIDYYWNDYKDDSPLNSLFAHSSFNWKKLTSFIVTFKIQLEKTVQYPNDLKNDRTLHRLWGHSNFNWKRQFSIEMISKITELHILREEIQTKTEKDRLVLKWLQRWQNLTFFVGTFKFRLKKQFSVKMILKITKPYILCGDIQIPTEKDSLVLKSFQRWQNLTFFVGTFKFRLTEPHIFCWDIQIHLKKTVQYWNDFKDDGLEHLLWWHSNPTEKKKFSINRFERSQNFT